jgi:predicted peptidase
MESKKKYPVILSLHGAGGKGNDNKRQLKPWNQQLAEDKVREDYPAYVLAPQSPGLWNTEMLTLIKEVIAEIPNADLNRIYILGHSMGGHGTFIYIQADPTYFAAAAPSAGTGLKSTADFIKPELIKDIPIWTSHGDQDRVCPYDRIVKMLEEMKRLNGNFKLTTWQGGNHGVSDRFIHGHSSGVTLMSGSRCDQESQFMTWLFNQKKN